MRPDVSASGAACAAPARAGWGCGCGASGAVSMDALADAGPRTGAGSGGCGCGRAPAPHPASLLRNRCDPRRVVTRCYPPARVGAAGAVQSAFSSSGARPHHAPLTHAPAPVRSQRGAQSRRRERRSGASVRAALSRHPRTQLSVPRSLATRCWPGLMRPLTTVAALRTAPAAAWTGWRVLTRR